MNAVVVAATVTVHFIGLVSFQNTGAGRKVILPLANVARAHQTKMLEAHHASIEITHLTKAECDSLEPFVPTGLKPEWTAGTPSLCRVPELSGVDITLPTTATGFRTTAEFDKIPRLQTLCPAISRMRPKFDLPANYAAKLTLTSGELDAYQNVSAWISRIELTSTPAKLVLSRGTTRKEVDLSNGAVVRLRNEPAPGSSGTEQQHFWWYYVMSENSCECENIPPGAAARHEHSTTRGRSGDSNDVWDAASGPGCSNTNFP